MRPGPASCIARPAKTPRSAIFGPTSPPVSLRPRCLFYNLSFSQIKMASLLALRRPPALSRTVTAPFVAVGRRGIFDYEPVKPLGDRIDQPKSYPFVLLALAALSSRPQTQSFGLSCSFLS